MSGKNNSDNLQNNSNTPKKLPVNKSLSSDENNQNQYSTPKTQPLYIISLNSVEVNMPPISKYGQSFLTALKYPIYNERGHKMVDVYDKLTMLDEYNVKETKIIRNISQVIDVDSSTITSTHQDPNVAHPLERCIIDYPQFFESSSISRFIKRTRISITNSSVVFICVNRFTGKSFVVKSGFKPHSEHHYLTVSSRAIINEVKILTLIGRHVHIVDYYDSWIEDESYRIQLELVRGGSLLDFIIGNKKLLSRDMSDIRQRISHCSAFILLAQMSSVLAYLYDYLRVFHGNIEPSNILVDLWEYQTEDTKGECHKALLEPVPNRLLRFKLCDFSQSGLTNTPYQPIRDHLPYSSRDIQSLGLTIYNCFGGVINSNILTDIQNGHMIANLSNEWREIIQKMCCVNESNRFTAREIIEMDNVRAFVLPESLFHLQYEADTKDLKRIKWT